MRIGIEGEKAFKAALRDINQRFKVLGSEMQLVTSQFDKNDSSVRALSARNEVLNKGIDQQRGKIGTLRAALQNASDSFGENDRRTQSWQIQLNRAQAELNGMEREVEQNSRALDDLSRSAENDATHLGGAADSADGLSREVRDLGGEMDGTGKKTSLFGDMLKANLLSEAIMGGVRALGSAIAGIGKSFTGAIKDGAEYNAQMESYTASFTTMLGDQAKAQKLVTDLKKEAAATPFGMQDLAGAMQTLMGFGMSAADAQKHMQELGDISQGDSERFKSLTLAFAQASSAGKLTGQDLLQMINAGFNPLEEMSRKTGKSIGELKQEMEQGDISAAMLADAFASATSEGGRFYGSMEAQSKTFSGQMSTLEDNVSSLKGQLSEGLTAMLSGTVLPMVNGWLGELSTAFSQDGAKGLIDAFGGILQEAVQFVSKQLPIVVDIAAQIIISLVQGLTAALPQITEAAVTLPMTLVNGLIKALPAITNAAAQVIATIVSGIAQALPQLIPAAVSAVTQIVQGLIENLPLILDAALQLIVGLAQGLVAAIPQLVAALPAIIGALVDFLLNSIPQIIQAGIELLTSLITALPTIITSIVAAIPKTVNNVISAVIGSIPLIIDAGVKLLVSLIQNLPLIITTVIKAIPQIVTALVGAITGNIDKIILAGVQLLVALVANLPAIIAAVVKAMPQIVAALVSAVGSLTYMMADAGSNLIKGLWQGILSVKDWICSKMQGFFNDIVDDMRDFFGIHSPSTLFAGFGRNMGEGIGVGFEDAMNQVSRDMRAAIPTRFDVSANAQGSYTGSNAAGAYAGANITQNISITSPKALSEKEAAREFKNLSRKLALGIWTWNLHI